mmetsp:Transcript_34640/g.80882  ORF Transcript_34640/g.80882 Transcript_34640/m.80882 type:complete len:281 (-) Transcript_34640:33-875(-)
MQGDGSPVCAACGSIGKLKRCCQDVFYCDASCQKRDVIRHRREEGCQQKSSGSASQPHAALSNELRIAKPSWSVKELQAAVDKLVAVGITSKEELTSALKKETVNSRMQSAGLKAFKSETLEALRQHFGVSKTLNGQKPTPSEASKPPTTKNARAEPSPMKSGPPCLRCRAATEQDGSDHRYAHTLHRSIFGVKCEHGPYCLNCVQRMQRLTLPFCLGCSSLVDRFEARCEEAPPVKSPPLDDEMIATPPQPQGEESAAALPPEAPAAGTEVLLSLSELD